MWCVLICGMHVWFLVCMIGRNMNIWHMYTKTHYKHMIYVAHSYDICQMQNICTISTQRTINDQHIMYVIVTSDKTYVYNNSYVILNALSHTLSHIHMHSVYIYINFNIPQPLSQPLTSIFKRGCKGFSVVIPKRRQLGASAKVQQKLVPIGSMHGIFTYTFN